MDNSLMNSLKSSIRFFKDKTMQTITDFIFKGGYAEGCHRNHSTEASKRIMQ